MESIQSNVIIKTIVKPPTNSGFSTILSQVDKLEQKLTALAQKTFTVNVNVTSNIAQATKQVSAAARQSTGGGAGSTTGGTTGGGTAGGTAGGGQRPVRPFGGVVEKTVTSTKEGELTRSVETSRQVKNNLENVQHVILEINKDGIKTNKLRTEEIDLIRKAETADKRRLVIAQRLRASVAATSRGNRERVNRRAGRLVDTGFTVGRVSKERATFTKQHVDPVTGEAVIVTAELDRVTGKLKVTRKADTSAAKAQAQVQREVNKAHSQALQLQKAEANTRRRATRLRVSGFKEKEVSTVTDAATGTQQRIRTFVQSSGNALTGYQVKVERLNEVTGKFTKETLTGARAVRFLGDSVQSAAMKVGLWTVATGVIFGFIRTVREAVNVGKELESQTVLLARVGRNLTFDPGANFKERLKEARALTEGILEITAAIGGDALEAQQAAAIFLRAGQTRQEALRSVEAALIAHRIAEIGVVEAASLLSSALQQFGLDASQLLPILDSLNTLSNKYKVTTDDLLQSISRAGSVFADHGGRLTELSAITAVLSETTARTGTQIGNAMKTIQSRLDRLDVKKKLFTQLGISLTDVAGNSKTLGQILLELQIAFENLSEAEKNEVGLISAGIRQRNFLSAAVNNAQKIIQAEITAVKEHNSAMSELGEQSNTVVAALARLNGEFQALAGSASPAVLEIVQTIVSLLKALIRLIGVFDGTAAQVLITLTALFLLGKAFTFVSAKLGIVAKGTRFYNAVLAEQFLMVQKNSIASRIFGGTLLFTAASLKAATVAAWGFVTSLVVILGPIILIGAAITGVMWALGAWADSEENLSAAIDDRLERSNKAVNDAEKQAAAIRGITNSILDQIAAVRALRIEEDRGGPDRSAKRRAAAKITRGAAHPLGVDIGDFSSGSAESVRAAVSKITEVELEQRRKTIAALRIEAKAAEEKKQQAGRLRESQLDYRTVVVDIGQGKRLATTSKRVSTETAASLATKIKIEALDKKINDNLVKQKKQEHEINFEVQNRLRIELLEINVRNTLTKLRKTQESRGPALTFTKLFGLSEEREVSTQLKASQAFTSELQAQLAASKTLLRSAEEIEAIQKALSGELGKQTTLMLRQVQLQQKARQNYFADRLKTVATLGEAVGTATLAASNRIGEVSSFGRKLSQIDAQRQRSINRVSTGKQRLEEAGLNRNSAAEQAVALRMQEADELEKLRKLEIDRAKLLLVSEKEITAEKHVQAKEAAKALGLLSMTDRFRVIGQAQFFAKNPNKQISFAEQLFASADTNKIGQQFFGSRMDKFDPTVTGDRTTQMLTSAGFGLTRDLKESEDAMRKARGGMTDQEIINQAQGREATLAEQEGIARGDDAVRGAASMVTPGGTGLTFDANGQARTNIEVSVSQNAFDLTQLTDKFEVAVNRIVDIEFNRVVAEVEAIIDQKLKVDKPKTLGG